MPTARAPGRAASRAWRPAWAVATLLGRSIFIGAAPSTLTLAHQPYTERDGCNADPRCNREHVIHCSPDRRTTHRHVRGAGTRFGGSRSRCCCRCGPAEAPRPKPPQGPLSSPSPAVTDRGRPGRGPIATRPIAQAAPAACGSTGRRTAIGLARLRGGLRAFGEPYIRPGPLAGEQRSLTALFQGTPVRVSSEPDGAVRVELPADVAFEHGATEPSPGLRAVLQHLGSSLQRQPTARLALGAPRPAVQRQIAMRAPLRALGLPAHRVSGTPTAGSRPVVAMRLALAPSAIGRLRDRDLPVAPVASTASLRPPAIR